MAILEFLNEDGSEVIAEVEITNEEFKTIENHAKSQGISMEEMALQILRRGVDAALERDK